MIYIFYTICTKKAINFSGSYIQKQLNIFPQLVRLDTNRFFLYNKKFARKKMEAFYNGNGSWKVDKRQDISDNSLSRAQFGVSKASQALGNKDCRPFHTNF